MDHARPHDAQQNKGYTVRHKEHSEGSVKKRPSESCVKSATQTVKTSLTRARSPSRPRAWISNSFKPRFAGRFYRPHFFRDDHSFRKPGPGVGFQRYHNFTPRPYLHWRDRPEPREREMLRKKEREGRSEQREKTDTSSPPKENGSTLGSLFPKSVSSREKDKQFSEGEEIQSRDRERGKESKLPSTASQAAARSRAIQQKRREIEEVYRQDCDAFGVVVRMLIAKDPSLEHPIQSSLQENLREIGMRCVEAMQRFIEEYDSKDSH
ncbi:uncharacterized protein ACJ7VT_014038 isoform 2-T2 [Polymixia lowei]